VPGRGPQHAERGDAYRQPVTGRGRPERQRAGERRRLLHRQRVQLAEHRAQEISQRGEGQFRLGFGPAGPDHRDRIA